MRNFDVMYYVADVSEKVCRAPKWAVFFESITQPITTIPNAEKRAESRFWFKNVFDCATKLQKVIDENICCSDLTDVKTFVEDDEVRNLLSGLLLQLCAYEVLCGDKKEAPNKEVLCSRCNAHLEFLTDIFQACGTLSCAEGQLKAYERQIKNYRTRKDEFPVQTEFYNHYWKNSPNESFYGELVETALKYLEAERSDYCNKEHLTQGLKNVWKQCSHQPLPSMFIPIILTLYCINPSNDSAIYPKMKPMRQYQHTKTPDSVLKLYDSITQIIDNHTNDIFTCSEVPNVCLSSTKDHLAYAPTIPRFRWSSLVDAFCACQGDLSVADRDFVKRCFILTREKMVFQNLCFQSFRKNHLEKICAIYLNFATIIHSYC